jgi:hypothetical protein
MPDPSVRLQLRFRSLFKPGKDLAFPCDVAGHVDLGALSEQARQSYRFARSMVGREFAMPVIQSDDGALGS